MNIMRYTVVDGRGAISFVADCDSLNAMVAACADGPRSVQHFLEALARYDSKLTDHITSGLAVFDEHNTADRYDTILAALKFLRSHELPVFRVLDDSTREASLHQVKAGVILFNLMAKRIVQIQNTYREVRRKGRLLLRGEKQAAMRVHRYELPAEWSLVP